MGSTDLHVLKTDNMAWFMILDLVKLQSRFFFFKLKIEHFSFCSCL